MGGTILGALLLARNNLKPRGIIIEHYNEDLELWGNIITKIRALTCVKCLGEKMDTEYIVAGL